MFAGFSQYILKTFFIYTQQKTCPCGQVFNNDGLQAAQTGSIVCNHQFFVGRNHNGNSFAVGSGNYTGIAENSDIIRERVLGYLGFLGLHIDQEANLKARFGNAGVITTADSKAVAVVIPTNEELMIAHDTARLSGL